MNARPPADTLLQRRSGQKFHGDERAAALLADVINRADIRMVERRSRFGLTLESFQRLRIARQFVREEFQSHSAVQPGVFSLKNDTHPAATKLFEHTIMGNSPSGE